jgi:hypothetical protein
MIPPHACGSVPERRFGPAIHRGLRTAIPQRFAPRSASVRRFCSGSELQCRVAARGRHGLSDETCSILRGLWSHLNGVQRPSLTLAVLCVFMIGGALYWEEAYEKQFALWTSTQAKTVASMYLSVLGELLEAVGKCRR